MYVQRALLAAKKPCWLAGYRNLMLEAGGGCSTLFDYWLDGGFEARETSRMETRGDVQVRVPLERDVQLFMKVGAFSTWFDALAKPEAKRGEGGNKLRTYARFRKECACAPHLLLVHDERKRVLLTKFRVGVAPLRIETGRYECTGLGTKGVPALRLRTNARVCVVDGNRKTSCISYYVALGIQHCP